MWSQRQVLVAVVVFYALILISPVFPYFGISGSVVTIGLSAALFVVFGGAEIRLSNWFPFVVLTILILACIPAIFWVDARYVLATILLIFPVLLLQWLDSRALEWVLTLATGLMLVLLVGAVIGFVLALSGVQPLFDIANSDGRPNYFYYTTFSNTRWENVIRPSAIYDEPGAFSFMICAVSAVRHLRGRDARVTWLMLGMGFVTLSLAHLVYVLLHALAERSSFRNVAGIVVTLLPLLVVAGYLGGFDILEKRLLSRATVTESGVMVQSNRSRNMINAVDYLRAHPQSIFFGVDPSCRFDQSTCRRKFPLMGEIPLSPLVFNGILISWPYYLTLAILFIAPVFGRKYIVSIAFAALLLQRPYVLGIGYSLINLLVVVSTIGGIVGDRYGERILFLTNKHSARIMVGNT
jgi:hypothetical protein